jgi:tRNA-5-taurinomethyluridine 2-sulfurtransferase
MADVPCTVRVAAHSLDTQDTIVIITPHNPQKAVASGQIAALWDGERCLGSGIITQTN